VTGLLTAQRETHLCRVLQKVSLNRIESKKKSKLINIAEKLWVNIVLGNAITKPRDSAAVWNLKGVPGGTFQVYIFKSVPNIAYFFHIKYYDKNIFTRGGMRQSP